MQPNALPLVNIGTVYLMAGDRMRATSAFTEALQVDEANARAHNALGIDRGRDRPLADAVAHWSRAVPSIRATTKRCQNLGELLVRADRRPGRPYWERYVAAGAAGPRIPGHRAGSPNGWRPPDGSRLIELHDSRPGQMHTLYRRRCFSAGRPGNPLAGAEPHLGRLTLDSNRAGGDCLSSHRGYLAGLARPELPDGGCVMKVLVR